MSVTTVAPVVVRPLTASKKESAGDMPAPSMNGMAPHAPAAIQIRLTARIASRRVIRSDTWRFP